MKKSAETNLKAEAPDDPAGAGHWQPAGRARFQSPRGKWRWANRGAGAAGLGTPGSPQTPGRLGAGAKRCGTFDEGAGRPVANGART